MGHSSFQVSACAFNKGKLKVGRPWNTWLSTAYVVVGGQERVDASPCPTTGDSSLTSRCYPESILLDLNAF